MTSKLQSWNDASLSQGQMFCCFYIMEVWFLFLFHEFHNPIKLFLHHSTCSFKNWKIWLQHNDMRNLTLCFSQFVFNYLPRLLLYLYLLVKKKQVMPTNFDILSAVMQKHLKRYQIIIIVEPAKANNQQTNKLSM